MGNEYKSIEERVDGICRWTNEGLRDVVLAAMKELARDQRHLCAEAVQEQPQVAPGDGCVDKHEAYQAVFNTRIK